MNFDELRKQTYICPGCGEETGLMDAHICSPAIQKLIVEKIEQTCNACPSQWEGKLASGNGIYIRYRWGWLEIEVEIGFSNQSYSSWWQNSATILDKKLGDDLDGDLSFDELKQATNHLLYWDKVVFTNQA